MISHVEPDLLVPLTLPSFSYHPSTDTRGDLLSVPEEAQLNWLSRRPETVIVQGKQLSTKDTHKHKKRPTLQTGENQHSLLRPRYSHFRRRQNNNHRYQRTELTFSKRNLQHGFLNRLPSSGNRTRPKDYSGVEYHRHPNQMGSK